MRWCSGGATRLAATPFEMHQEERNGGRCDAGNARRLADGSRADAGEFLLHFGGKTTYLVVVELLGQTGFLVTTLTRYLFVLTFDVACVLRLNFHLLSHLGVGDARADAGQHHQRSVAYVGAA